MGLTKTQAVNIMLRAIGESPISDISDNSSVDVVMAKDIIEDVSRELQSSGWHFNTEYEVPLTRDANNEIQLPANTLQVDIEGSHKPTDTEPVQRGTKLYDSWNRTYTWDKDLKARIVYKLSWDDLPEQVKTYIAKQSAILFQKARISPDFEDRQLQREMLLAWSAFTRSDSANADHNLLQSPTVLNALLRREPLRYAYL